MIIEKATYHDLEEILELQKKAFYSEALLYNDFTIQPLNQTVEEIEKEFESMIFLKTIIDGHIVGSVRGKIKDGVCYIGKLIVHPDYQNKGIGKKLMVEMEARFKDADLIQIFTGHKSEKNIKMYSRLGYEIYDKGKVNDNTILVFMQKKVKK